ncbi:MAG: AMP-binding protein, partial [Acidimicrobiales bacterium]
LGRLRTLPAADLPAGRAPPADVAPRDPATIIYTSGTTGPAKGVVHAHHFAFSAAAVKIGTWGLGPDDVLFSALPLFHANARYSTLLTACVLDARAVLVERFSASAFWEQVAAAGATEVASVGTVAAILLERAPGRWDRAHRVRMMHGAGALPGPRRAEFEERFGVRLVNGFSMTETSHFSTTSPDDPGRNRGAGRPVPGFTVAIVDGDDQAVPAGAVGEIVVRPELAWSIFLGYHRDPQATVDSFANLWFHTGDLGRIDEDGYLHWIDRTKDAIRRRGEMVSSRDVEEAALSLASVAEASAVGVPGDLGEEEVLLVVRAAVGDDVDLPALLDHCRRRLPDFAVPRYFRVVDELPHLATHKVDKRRLRQAWPAPDGWDAAAGQPGAQPARSSTSR